jgi:hypothetical protein
MKNHISALFEKAETHLKTTVELYKLKMIDKSADVISSLTANFIIAFLALLVIGFFHIGAALWIGACLGRLYYGFFIVAGFYSLATILVIVFRTSWIKRPAKQIFIKKLLN